MHFPFEDSHGMFVCMSEWKAFTGSLVIMLPIVNVRLKEFTVKVCFVSSEYLTLNKKILKKINL